MVNTREAVSPEGERQYEKSPRCVKSLWDENLSQLVSELGICDPATRVVLLLSRSGLLLTPRHQLDAEQPDIKADLAGEMCTIYGALTQILRARLAAHGEPVTA
ncbi:hypothetical protein MASR2M36_36740 [Providencia sp.]